ncbi:MAG: T9SS type A sorting domain-containing protein, partial [Chitinophagales bacterium]|nr:T9SS type A sorting domain-containing protein [Chitinophagales bacterium]
KPGSFWHHRANNGLGSFVNRKSFGKFIVENNATLTADGPVYRINNLTVEAGSSFITHTSGQTAVMGNIVVEGTLSSPAAAANELILAGNATQTISGTGSINIAGLIVGDRSTVVLNKSIGVDQSVIVNGKLNFGTHQLTGNAIFIAEGVVAPVTATGTTVTGSYQVTGNTLVPATARGQSIGGPGIAPNTVIVSFSITNDTIYLSNPLTASATGVALTVTTGAATLETSNTNGFDPVTGSAAVTGNKTYKDSINYIINAATSMPFGISTGSTATSVHTGFAIINAAVTTNKGVSVNEYLSLNGKMTLRPADTVHILNGAVINGSVNTSNYIATDYNSTTGLQSIVQYDGAVSAVTLPVGTVNYYLPVVITPTVVSDFAVAVFEGITTNAAVNGTPLTPAQKQTVVNAVWNINRLTGSGNADLQLGWVTALEGSTFTTLPSTDIGMIINNGSSWSLPLGVGDNTANTALAAVSSFGSFSAGAVPPAQPFIFNAIPVKTYGDPDFNGGATSLNTTQPVIYSSSDPAVATIVNGDIHIVGAGAADITASQASDGFYPAASVTRPLTVNKAALTVTADDKLKFEGQANPALTASYTGFVMGETAVVLLTPAVLTTTAVLNSPPGTYPITVAGATSVNYDISFVNGVLTVQPKQNQTITFNAIPTKTYGNADFAAGGSSTNNTIPITYTSSNTGVATIIGSTIHITGAGTTTITASQAGNAGYFPAADVSRTLTVNKVNLTVRARDTTKVEGQVNPDFTLTYAGFVLGETPLNLSPAPVVATTATTNSAAGYYALTPEGGVSQNYNFIYVAGRLTIYPPGGNGQQYMNAFMSNSTTLNVRVFSVEPVLGDIRLYDLAGRPLMKKNFFMPSGFATTTIQIPTLPSGLYVVAITGNGVDLKKTIPIIK